MLFGYHRIKENENLWNPVQLNYKAAPDWKLFLLVTEVTCSALIFGWEWRKNVIFSGFNLEIGKGCSWLLKCVRQSDFWYMLTQKCKALGACSSTKPLCCFNNKVVKERTRENVQMFYQHFYGCKQITLRRGIYLNNYLQKKKKER